MLRLYVLSSQKYVLFYTDIDYQKYIKSDKSSGRSKDISKNKEIDNSRNINLSNTKQSINIKINNTINPFRDDSLKGR